MEQFAETVAQYGIGIAAFAAGGWFFMREIWPWFKESQRDQLEEQRKHNKNMYQLLNKLVEQSSNHSQEIERVNDRLLSIEQALNLNKPFDL